jgi:transcriptional regulator with XRE-family HTH domain
MNEKQDRSKRFAQLIGIELKANFARAEMSQAEVAEKLGHSKSGYSRWLNAKPSIPFEAFLNTCELIGVNPATVIETAYGRLISEMGTPDSSPILDVSQLTDEQKTQIVLEKLRQGDMTLQANTDPDKEAMANGGENPEE